MNPPVDHQYGRAATRDDQDRELTRLHITVSAASVLIDNGVDLRRAVEEAHKEIAFGDASI
jgi:hypothetical protein